VSFRRARRRRRQRQCAQLVSQSALLQLVVKANERDARLKKAGRGVLIDREYLEEFAEDGELDSEGETREKGEGPPMTTLAPLQRETHFVQTLAHVDNERSRNSRRGSSVPKLLSMARSALHTGTTAGLEASGTHVTTDGNWPEGNDPGVGPLDDRLNVGGASRGNDGAGDKVCAQGSVPDSGLSSHRGRAHNHGREWSMCRAREERGSSCLWIPIE
jgi:hypothetical protein